MASVIEIGTLIDRDPKVRGGRPKIAGTGLTVSRIAIGYKMGMTPEEIALEYPHLTLAQVHAALAYYHVNRDEIEADIAEQGSGGSPLGAGISEQARPTMSRVRLYLDEDAMRRSLVFGLRARGVDVLTAAEASMVNRAD
jgi:uncharacterized protein (DUF433 family)